MSRHYFGFSPYVPVGQRRQNATKEIEKLRKQGKTISPVQITGKKITTSFWGNAWCENLSNYSDFANRMPRGRTYVRNGSVVHLEIDPSFIEAYVAGSSLYKSKITIAPLSPTIWKNIIASSSGKITNLLDLLQGKLPKEVLADICNPDDGIFPKPNEIKFSCTCPDGASMCKHIAAVLYAVGHRLDTQPELFFTLRSVDMQELITSASVQTSTELADADAALANDDLANIFGIEIDSPSIPTNNKIKKAPTKKSPTKKSPTKKSPTKKAPTKKAPTKKAPTKKAPTKKAPTKKAPTKKAPTKKSPTKKAPTKKAPAKKAPAKKASNKNPNLTKLVGKRSGMR